MLTLSMLADAIEKIEVAIKATEKDRSLNQRLWDQRAALNMAATYFVPNTPDEALFLHNLIEEYAEFVDNEPTRESDRDDTIEAISRMNESLRGYAIGA